MYLSNLKNELINSLANKFLITEAITFITLNNEETITSCTFVPIKS